MAREKGMGSLQLEKSGRWTLRVGINGKRYSRSTGTCDREKAERYLQRYLAPLGLGKRRLPLAEVWQEYVKSPNRNDLATTTLNSKRIVWMNFASWMEQNYLPVKDLAGITSDAIAEYLANLRSNLCASTYNSRVCILREIFHVLAGKAGLEEDPWDGVRLRPDDAHSRRELTKDELTRLLNAAKSVGEEWHTLFMLGIFTGQRLKDCCCLEWSSVHLDVNVIQLIPSKTRRHTHGQPVTIPIHSSLRKVLEDALKAREDSPYVIPAIAATYRRSRWQVSHELSRIFKTANIVTSVRIEGRRNMTPDATFHSLRHTFVSMAGNAGVPLHAIQMIVGHTSTAMTRHYYHESVGVLRQAVDAIPALV